MNQNDPNAEGGVSKSGIVLVSDIYPDNIIVLPLETRPVFPGLTLPMNFIDKTIVKYVNYAVEKNNGLLGVSLIEEENEEDNLDSKLFKTGTLIKVLKIAEQSEDNINFFALL